MPSPPPETTTYLTPFHPGKNSGSAHATYIIYYKYFAFMAGTKHNPALLSRVLTLVRLFSPFNPPLYYKIMKTKKTRDKPMRFHPNKTVKKTYF